MPEEVDNPVGQVVGINEDGSFSVLMYGDREPRDLRLNETHPLRRLPRRRIKVMSDGTLSRTFISLLDEDGDEVSILDGVTKIDVKIDGNGNDEIVKAYLEITMPHIDIVAEEGCRIVRRE